MKRNTIQPNKYPKWVKWLGGIITALGAIAAAYVHWRTRG